MIISASTRLAQMRSEIEATYEMASQSHVQAQAAIDKANELLDADLFDPTDDKGKDNDDVIGRVNDLIEQAFRRPH
jgi:hypothetical protein